GWPLLKHAVARPRYISNRYSRCSSCSQKPAARSGSDCRSRTAGRRPWHLQDAAKDLQDKEKGCARRRCYAKEKSRSAGLKLIGTGGASGDMSDVAQILQWKTNRPNEAIPLREGMWIA